MCGRRRRDGVDGVGGRRAVDAGDDQCRPCPRQVRHRSARAIGDEVDAVEHAGIGAERLRVVAQALPRLIAVEAVDARDPVVVAQRIQQPHQRGQRIGGSAAEHARVHRAGQRVHPHVDVGGAAQRGHQRRPAHRDVAHVGDEDDVGGEQLRPRASQVLQAGGAALLGALHHDPDARQLDARRRVVVKLLQRPQGPQSRQMHDHVALAVRGAAAVPAAVALVERPGIGGPGGNVPRRLDVVVGIEENRRAALRGGDVPGQRDGTVDRDMRIEVDAGLREQLGHAGRGVAAGVLRVLFPVHRREGDEVRQFLLDGGAVRRDLLADRGDQVGGDAGGGVPGVRGVLGVLGLLRGVAHGRQHRRGPGCGAGRHILHSPGSSARNRG